MKKYSKYFYLNPNPIAALKSVPRYFSALSTKDRLLFSYPVIAAVVIGVLHLGNGIGGLYVERLSDDWIVRAGTFLLALLLVMRNPIAYFLAAPGYFFFGGFAHLFGTFEVPAKLAFARVIIYFAIYLIPSLILLRNSKLFLEVPNCEVTNGN